MSNLNAGQGMELLRIVAMDTAAESDPGLRAWYETEISLTPEFKEAIQIKSRLEGLAAGIDALRMRREAGAAVQPETNELAEEIVDFDQYLTPSEREQKSIELWTVGLVREYDQDVKEAQATKKASKRTKQLELAQRRFVRHFETFGEDPRHITFDAEALSYALDHLAGHRPKLAEAVAMSSETYARSHGLELAADAPAFAAIIAQSINQRPSAPYFDRIFSAIYSGRNFVNQPQDALKLHTHLAYAMLEPDYIDQPRFYHKVIETVYLANGIIKDQGQYFDGWNSAATVFMALPQYSTELVEFANANLAFSQAKYAFTDNPEQFGDLQERFADKTTASQQLRRMIEQFGGQDTFDKVEHVVKNEEDITGYLRYGQHYDIIDTFNMVDGSVSENATNGKTVPPEWSEAFETSELRKKRIALLAPRAIASDLIVHTLRNTTGLDITPEVVHMPLSPGITVSYCSIQFDDSRLYPGGATSDGDLVINKLLREHSEWLTLDRLAPEPGKTAVMATLLAPLTNDKDLFTYLAVRRSVPADAAQAEPHMPLVLSLQDRLVDYRDTPAAEATIQEKLALIKQHQHNYPGRRPIKFEMPAEIEARGLKAVRLRKHEDRRRLVVTAEHAEGDIEFVFLPDLSIDRRHHYGTTDVDTWPLQLAFQDMVVSLYQEWACREIIETSEGTVRKEDQKSRVNLGFLRYLPQGQKFSPNQARIFWREQHGDLAQESRRLKSLDPRGEGRNSTYVRETFDPNKPPLVVYYDHDALRR